VEGEHVKYAAHRRAASRGRAVTEHGSTEVVVSGNRFHVGLAGELCIPIHPHDREADRSVLIVVGDDYFGGNFTSGEEVIEDHFDFVHGAERLPGFGTSATVEVGKPVEPASGSLVEERDMHLTVDDPALSTLFERDMHGRQTVSQPPLW
jgi:hypothetical protein